MTKRTPGPWGLVWEDDVVRIRLNGSTVYQVSDVTDPEFPSGKPRCNLYDMRLIAAAPELLSVCKAALHQMENGTGANDLRSLFRSVISKAEGRSE